MSAVILQPFKVFGEEIRPPRFEYEPKNGYIEPGEDYVVSWRNGIVLSRYGDDVWDLSPYGNKDSKVKFGTIPGDIQKKEAKRLLFIYMTHGGGRGGTLPAGSTVASMFTAIRTFAEYAHQHTVSISDLLKNNKKLKIFIAYSARKHTSTRIFGLRTVLTTLEKISAERSGFAYKKDKVITKMLNAIARKAFDDQNQTLLIPVSIYASAAKSRWKHISFIEKHLTKLVAFLVDYTEYRGFGYKQKDQLTKDEQKYYVLWNEAVAKHDIQQLFNKYDVKTRQEFESFLFSLQRTCRHLIHQYTGMRNSEGANLTYDCWRDKRKEMPSRVFGKEKKVHGVPTAQVWITHDEIERVIDLLNAIGDPMRKKLCPHLKQPPLMIRPKLLASREIKERNFDDLVSYPLGKQANDLDLELPLDIEGITITEEHIEEMSLVDDRDWSQHKWVRIGEKWRFAPHQYRRSLAVYALGSGLVSLHAIKEQFGHLISTMTAYYANGYKRARKLDGSIDEDSHIARYILGIRAEMKFYCYRKNVLLSKTPLWGANGLHLAKHLVAKTPEEREIVIRDSKKTISKFKKGLIDYQDTAMGACLNSQCSKFLLPDFFISCKGCEHAIHKLKKIEILAEKQRQVAMQWANIHPDGIDHRTAVALAIEIENFANVLRRKEKKESEIA